MKFGHSGIRAHRALPGIKGAVAVGLGAIFASFGGLTAWSALAPLASAAIAPGFVVVDGNRRTVQHPDGGLVKAINVRDGDRVTAGQVLISLDETRVLNLIDTLRPSLALNIAQRVRLEAERLHLAEPDFSVPEVAGVRLADFPQVVAQQRRLFASRRSALDAKIAAHAAIREQSEQALHAHQQQLMAHRDRIRLSEVELQAITRLTLTRDAPAMRLTTLQRSIAEVQGDAARAQSLIADARGRITGAILDAVTARAEFEQAADEDIQRNDREHVDLRERLLSALDQARRLEVTAPVSGRIVNRAFHTVGGVIGQGSPIMEIVPDEQLFVHAEVRPNDIDRVRPGLPVEIRLSGLDGGLLPRLVGTVVTVSADRIVDRVRNTAYFEVRIAVPDEMKGRLADRELRPGMLVDVMIVRGERTVFEYLGSSFFGMLAAAMRE